MTVMILERVAPSLRGDLSRWLVEIKTGVFVGRISKLVREALWERCVDEAERGTVLQIWKANNEQGLDLRAHNPRGRIPVDHEGIWLAEVSDSDPRREP